MGTPAPTPQPLAAWAALAASLGATTKKLEKRALLATALRALPLEDAERTAQYIAGEAFAETDPRKLQTGGSLLTKAVLARTGTTPAALSQAFRRHGDIGDAAWELMEAAPAGEAPGLTLAELGTLLAALAAARGPAPRLALLRSFLARAGAEEARYTLKLIAGDMRIGVKHALVEEAIAEAYAQSLEAVRHAGMLLGSLRAVVERALAGTLEEARMQLFHPLGFMLASPVDSVEEAVERFAEEVAAERQQVLRSAPDDLKLLDAVAPETALREAYLEDKYDGVRVQLHAGDATQPGRVGLYSRTREDLSAAFPELTAAFARLPEPVILDGEVLAWAPAVETPGRALPFSSLQARLGRKVVSDELRRTVPVVFMAFDMLYADGRLLLELPLRKRRERLARFVHEHAAVTAGGGETAARAQASLFAEPPLEAPVFPRLLLASQRTLASAAQLDAAYLEARAHGNEGVMLKAAASRYQPGRRGLEWLKLKRELATLDVVVTAAEFGHGRRAGYLSDYTFAVRGPSYETAGELLNVGKAYSGITDAEMYTLSEHFHETTTEDHGHTRLVAPDTVFEVAFNNIMRSDRHASGFALRFPRILRIREDKPVAEIDTLERVAQLYEGQPDRPREPGER